MGLQIQGTQYYLSPKNLLFSPPLSPSSITPLKNKNQVLIWSNSCINGGERKLQNNQGLKYPLFGKKKKDLHKVLASSSSSSGNVAAPLWDTWTPDKASASPCISDILWPSLGAFVAMVMLGKMDEMLASRGISMTIAPFGAVCAVLFISPKSPAARKYNMFMAQIGCAAIGVLAFSMLGPGWLARSLALAASIAFMIYTRSTHPPAASLPLLFIDGAKFHHLRFWYAFIPCAVGCFVLSIIQECVCYLKENLKF